MVIFQASESASFGSGRRRGNRKKHKSKRQLHRVHFNPCIFAQIVIEAARKRAMFFSGGKKNTGINEEIGGGHHIPHPSPAKCYLHVVGVE